MNYVCTYCLTTDFYSHAIECPKDAIARSIWEKGFEDGMKRRLPKCRDPFYDLGWRIGVQCRDANDVACGHDPKDAPPPPTTSTPAPARSQMSLF